MWLANQCWLLARDSVEDVGGLGIPSSSPGRSS
jgi:hypothetical protein